MNSPALSPRPEASESNAVSSALAESDSAPQIGSIQTVSQRQALAAAEAWAHGGLARAQSMAESLAGVAAAWGSTRTELDAGPGSFEPRAAPGQEQEPQDAQSAEA